MPPRRVAQGSPPDAADSLADKSRFVEFQQANPKKRGSAAGDRYERYKRARTVGEALHAGAQVGDLRSDLSKGYLRFVAERPDDVAELRVAGEPLAGRGSLLRSPTATTLPTVGGGRGGSLRRAAFCAAPPQSPLPLHRAAASSSQPQLSAEQPPPAPSSSLLRTLRSTLLERVEARRQTAGSHASALPALATALGGKAPPPAWQLDRTPRERARVPGQQPAAEGSLIEAASSPSATGSRWRCELLPSKRVIDDLTMTTPPPVEQPAPRPAATASCIVKDPYGLPWQVGSPPQLAPLALPLVANAVSTAGPLASDRAGDDLSDSDGELLAAFRLCEDRVRGQSLGGCGVTGAAVETTGLQAADAPATAAVDPAPASREAAADIGIAAMEPAAAACKEELSTAAASCGSEGNRDPEITLRLRLGCAVVKQEPDDDLSALRPDTAKQALVAAVDAAVEDGPEAVLDSELGDGEESLTLRCRLGALLQVKQEDEEPPEAAPPPPVSNITAVAVAVAGHLPAVAVGGDLRRLFSAQQRQAAEGCGAAKPEEEGGQKPEHQQAEEQFEAAQIASYESNVSERQGREARERELVQQGDIGPLEALDEELMAELYGAEGMLCWLESAEHRQLLFRYLELRARAVRWYRELAEAYFAASRRRLGDLLERPDAALVVTPFLWEETEKTAEALFAMPEKGRFLPQLFAPCSCDAGDVGGGCVELD